MGARVDIFVIESKVSRIEGGSGGGASVSRGERIEVRYSHWGADSPRETLLACSTDQLDEYEVGKGPMADCFAEMAIIVEPDKKILWWEGDDEEADDVEVPGWQVRRLSCYCAVYFELKRRGLWIWPRPKQDACMMLGEDQDMPDDPAADAVEADPWVLPRVLPMGRQMLAAGAEAILTFAPPWLYRPLGFAFYPCPCCNKRVEAEVFSLKVAGSQQWVGEPASLDVLDHVALQLPTARAGEPMEMRVRSRSKGDHMLDVGVRCVVAKPESA
jgi:hypothetical protein